jgi:hypothetical protein
MHLFVIGVLFVEDEWTAEDAWRHVMNVTLIMN